MRFSIRDLLWLTVVVAMGLGWWVSYRAVDAKRLEAVQQTQRHRAVLRQAKASNELLDRFLNDVLTGETSLARMAGPGPFEKEPGPSQPDWTVLDGGKRGHSTFPLIQPLCAACRVASIRDRKGTFYFFRFSRPAKRSNRVLGYPYQPG